MKEVYVVKTGDVHWRGMAESDDDAVKRAFDACPNAQALGTFIRIKRGYENSRWGLTEWYLRKLGLLADPPPNRRTP